MSNRALACVFRQSRQSSSIMLRGGGGHGVPPPPFARLPQETQPLLEETELVWNDGVAPELCIDFDAQHFTKTQGLLCFLGGFAFFGTFGALVSFSGPSKTRCAVSEAA